MNTGFIYAKSALWVQNNVRVANVMSMTPPAVVVTVGNYKTTWMDAPAPVDTGMEAMQADFKVGADADVLAMFGFAQGRKVRAQIRRVYQNADGTQSTWVDELEGIIGSITPDEHSNSGQESVGMAVVMNLMYYKLTVDSSVMYEIDILNCKRIINGVDQMSGVRDALLLD
ncbi:phage major tail tube protein [Enterobacter hormaechei]|uniref:phage major tail tube protein n=1 Tax=Enterobacter hormaechei TaxID=158836 RepID=UPI002A74904E|nr:phage major tail tube protein [Enterobacter hormaechei]MDY3572302.1 phage major tail tube protein [Enterobacter hormaechei]